MNCILQKLVILSGIFLCSIGQSTHQGLVMGLHEDSLESDEVLYPGEFLSSPSRCYEFGLSSLGNLVLLLNGDTTNPVWSADILGVAVCKMQRDGNFVCRASNGDALWASDTASNDGASLILTDGGRAMIDSNNGVDVWSVGETPPPPTTLPPTAAPIVTPSPVTTSPTFAPVTPTNAPVFPTITATSASGYAATIVLEPNEFLLEGQFVYSPNGSYKVGLRGDGEFVLETFFGTTLWSANITESYDTPGMAHRVYMQDDGNLVIREEDGTLLWDSDTYSNHGADLLMTDGGKVTIELNGVELWSSGGSASPVATATPIASPTTPNPVSSPPTNAPVTPTPTPAPTNSPITTAPTRAPTNAPVTPAPTPAPTNAPITPAPTPVPTNAPVTPAPTPAPTNAPVTPAPVPAPTTVSPVSPPQNFASTVVLESGGFLDLGQFFSSPNGDYQVGLSFDGELVLEESSSGATLWSAGIIDRYGSGRAFRCFLQSDGNVIIRDGNLAALWNSQTSNNHGSHMVIDDSGQIAIVQDETPIWVQGIPRGSYEKPPSSQDLHFPIRGSFYYPWYPETWTVNDAIARFEPQLGFYSSGDPSIVEEHVDMLEYAHTDLSIASWWGPDTNLDKARITLLMDKTLEMGSNMKWTIYHEDEFHEDASAAEIRMDLDYLKEWFAWHPTWAHIDGRPVVFVYNEVGCDVATRWMAASNSEWYVVLKLFKGFRHCSVQPDSWHQYGPADAVVQIPGHSFGVSPGFWRADIAEPRLDRVNEADFCANVELMVQSNDPWQLITTFNEAGEGTMVEPSPHWPSSSGYGFYLDCLHTYH